MIEVIAQAVLTCGGGWPFGQLKLDLTILSVLISFVMDVRPLFLEGGADLKSIQMLLGTAAYRPLRSTHLYPLNLWKKKFCEKASTI